MNNQKVKLYNAAILVIMAAIFAGVYMYARAEKVHKEEQCPVCIEEKGHDTCDEPCEDCVPRVPLSDI